MCCEAGPHCLLVAGENADARVALAASLRAAGYRVREVSDLSAIDLGLGRCSDELVVAGVDEHERTDERSGATILPLPIEPRIPNFVGSSPCAKMLARRTLVAAHATDCVSIHGGTGSGKSVVARAIHLLGRRRSGPYVAVHVNGDPSTALERSLFGHRVRGAGDSIHVHPGKLAEADGGTLYLEHVDRLPHKVQRSLLEFLDTGSATISGGDVRFSADVRIVSGSRDGLDIAVSTGRLLPELYARLEMLSIPVPPLRVRRDDIELLAHHFDAAEAAKAGRANAGFSDEVMRKLVNYSWPGNVQQLKMTIKRAFASANGGKICARHLRIERHSATGHWRHMPPIPGSSLDDIERYAILETLEQVEGDKGAAADILGISIRKIQYCVRRYASTSTDALESK